MTLRHGGEIWEYNRELVDFSANINPLGPSEKALEAIDSGKIVHYPPQDPVRLKEAVARYVGVEAGNIAVGNGSIELIRDFCSLFLRRGQRAAILQPTFSEYRRYGEIYGDSALDIYPSKAFEHSAADVVEAIREDEDVRVLFLCRPNNPTGWAMEERDLEGLIAFCLERGIYLFLDEVFIEFTGLKSYAELVNDYENLFVLRSFTKFFALPGLRVGYGVASPAIIERLSSIRPPWSINILAHDAAIASLEDREYMERTRGLVERERSYLASAIANLGVRVYPSEANFLLLKHSWNSKKVKESLLREGLLIRDCSTFPGLDTRFIRVSVRRREENERLLEALEKEAAKAPERGPECSYYPCHFEGQDCTFCFCPFYPCGDEKRGKLIVGKRGREVWSCKGCVDVHRKDVVARIQEALGGREPDDLNRKERLAIKEAVLRP